MADNIRPPSPQPRRPPEPEGEFKWKMQLGARPSPWNVVVVGLLSGWIFIIAQTAFAGSLANSAFLPWKAAASVVIGESNVERPQLLPQFIVGAITHFGLSVLFSAIYFYAVRHFVSRKGRVGLGREMVMGALYGLALWFVNFQVIARLFYPWFLTYPQPVQALLHAVAFGLPLGMMFSAVERRILQKQPGKVWA